MPQTDESKPTSAQVVLTSRDGQPISNMEEWRTRRKALNEGWVPGKSAWEIANAWVGTGRLAVPAELLRLLQSNERTRGLTIVSGVVEEKSSLRYSGGPRNHDLLLKAMQDDVLATIGIEAKASDGFDETLRDQIEDARGLHALGRNCNTDKRSDWLAECLLGVNLLRPDRTNFDSTAPGQSERSKILGLPSQLFAGVAGTLFAAKKESSSIAVFVVHQFRTEHTHDDEIKADARLLDTFAALLIAANRSERLQPQPGTPLKDEVLIGPIYLPERRCGKWSLPTEIPLFIGKILTDRKKAASAERTEDANQQCDKSQR